MPVATSHKPEIAAATADAPTVVIVDPKTSFRHYLARLLRRHGLGCLETGSASEAVELLDRGGLADLVLVCAGTGRRPVSENLDRLSLARHAVPAVVLTHAAEGEAAPETDERAIATIGWPDLLADPAARLSEVLGRPAGGDPSGGGRRGPLRLEPERSSVRWRGRRLQFSRADFAIVQLLVTHAGNDVSFARLFAAAGFPDDGSLDAEEIHRQVRAAVKRIRRKLRRIDPDFDAIRSYPGFGYRWLGDGRGGH